MFQTKIFLTTLENLNGRLIVPQTLIADSQIDQALVEIRPLFLVLLYVFLVCQRMRWLSTAAHCQILPLLCSDFTKRTVGVGISS